MVMPRDGGPYSLFCSECKRWIPNTANYEMRKEGFFAHSHICSRFDENEVEDSEWQEADCNWKTWHDLHLKRKNEKGYKNGN